MSSLNLNPFTQFNDLNSRPLDNGKVYVGQANLDPKDNPIDLFWDQAMTIAAVQPIPTLGGILFNDNAPGMIYADVDDFSVRVLDKKGRQIFFVPSMRQANLLNIGKGIPDSFISVQQPFSGAVTRTQDDKNRENITAKDFGGDADGNYYPVSDWYTPGNVRYRGYANLAAVQVDYPHVVSGTESTDWAALQAALNTGKSITLNAGTWFINRRMVMPSGARLIGVSRHLSIIKCNNTTGNANANISLSETGVLKTSGEPGGYVQGISFEFVQPSTNVRANAIQYPWAIDATGSARLYIDDIRISAAWNGINLTGNAGGSYLGFLEIGALNKGMWINGSFDFVHGTHWHFWVFGLTEANITQIYYDGLTVALDVGSVDGLNIDALEVWNAAILFNSGLPIHISKLGLDGSNSRIEVSGGTIQIGECYKTGATNGTKPGIWAKGSSFLDISQLYISSDISSSVIHVQDTANIKINSGKFVWINPNFSVVTMSGGNLTIQNVNWSYIGDTPPPTHINVTGGRLNLIANTWDETAFHTEVLSCSDENHVIYGNRFGTWKYTPPATQLLGTYGPNAQNFNGDFQNNQLSGIPRLIRLTGVSDGTGAALIAHSTAGLNLKVLNAKAWYKGSSGEAIPCNVAYIDGNNISVSGAVASRAIRVEVSYTLTNDNW